MGQPISAGHFALMYPSDHIKAADLRDKDVTVLVDWIEIGELRRAGTNKKEKKPILHMRAMNGTVLKKTLVLNVTNARSIAALYGPKVEAWKGKPVTLYPTMDRGPKGDQVECIRIRSRVGKGGDVTDEMAANPDPHNDDDGQDFTDVATAGAEAPKPAAPHDPHSDPPPPADVKLGTDREPGQEG